MTAYCRLATDADKEEYILKEMHGDPRFYKLLFEGMKLHSEKNKDYAQGGNPLGNFQRVSTIKRLYPGLPWDSPTGVCLGFLLKQLDAAMWMYSQGYEGEVETFAKRMFDSGVYSFLTIINKDEEKPCT